MANSNGSFDRHSLLAKKADALFHQIDADSPTGRASTTDYRATVTYRESESGRLRTVLICGGADEDG